jgi:hypothetical protein
MRQAEQLDGIRQVEAGHSRPRLVIVSLECIEARRHHGRTL